MKIIADDFGMDPAINKAILNLAETGKIHGVSIMINGSLELQQIQQIKRLRHQNKIQIGLHLELLSLKSFWPLPSSRKIQSSISYQLELFEKIFDRLPDFIDGHQHIHIYPIFKKPLMVVLAQLRTKPWIRSVRIPKNLLPKIWNPKRFYFVILNFFGSRLYQDLKKLNWPTNDFLYGSFANHGRPSEIFKSYLKLMPTQNETVYFCHPSLNSLDLPKTDPIYKQRLQDYEFLKNENISL